MIIIMISYFKIYLYSSEQFFHNLLLFDFLYISASMYHNRKIIYEVVLKLKN